MLQRRKFSSNRFLREITLISLNLLTILLVQFSLNHIVTNYHGIGFIPGLRIFGDRLFIDSSWNGFDAIEAQLGNLGIEILIVGILSRQISNFLSSNFSRNQNSRRPRYLGIFITLFLLFALNHILANNV